MEIQLKPFREKLEDELRRRLPSMGPPSAQFNQAVQDAIFPGGKRLRPLLCVFASQATGASFSVGLDVACAVEFIHTSSLILDDLPCMDDAALRRGRPALHITFGESIALLAAIALLNQSYAIFSAFPGLVQEAAACIGVEGMVGGQAIDLEPGTHDARTARDRLVDRNRKTSGLMRLALTAGAVAGGAPPTVVSTLRESGVRLGQAYQILDDLLDQLDVSKTLGQDRRHARASYAALVGKQAALQEATQLVDEATAAISGALGDGATELIGFIRSLFGEAQRMAA